MDFNLFYVVTQLSMTKGAAKRRRIGTETAVCAQRPKLSRADEQIAASAAAAANAAAVTAAASLQRE